MSVIRTPVVTLPQGKIVEVVEYLSSFVKVYKDLPISLIQINVGPKDPDDPENTELAYYPRIEFYHTVEVELQWELESDDQPVSN